MRGKDQTLRYSERSECGIISGTFFFVALFFLPETPKFLLIARSDREAAEQSVRFYHGSDSDVDTVIKEIMLVWLTICLFALNSW